MDRNYTNAELTMLVDNCIKTQTNMLPYCCRENIDAWMTITRCIRAVEKHKITPEQYWHGNYKEFTQLLILLADGYPSPTELLVTAEKGTTDEIQNIAKHFYQYIVVMFDYVKTHHGYVVLRPSSYMQNLHPNSKDMLYVYTTDKWTHKEHSNIGGAVLILPEAEINSLPSLLKKKIGII
jgi:hypothetical protein